MVNPIRSRARFPVALPMRFRALALLFVVAASGCTRQVWLWKLRETRISLLRAHAVLLEYKIRVGHFPGADPGAMAQQDAISSWGPYVGLCPIEKVAADLRRAGLESFPLVDAWGGPILYSSNGVECQVMSFGENRLADFSTYDGGGPDDQIVIGGRMPSILPGFEATYIGRVGGYADQHSAFSGSVPNRPDV